jgi:hypothetical protein
MQITGLSEDEKPIGLNQLARAEKNGQIFRIKRGLYITGEFYRKYYQDERFLPAISQMLYPESYVSTHFILQKNNIIPEATYVTTAMTWKNTTEFNNRIGRFKYQHIDPQLYLGFEMFEFVNFSYYQATTAKALFDYLYLKPIGRKQRKLSSFLAQELRLNLDDFSADQKDEFQYYVEISQSEKMSMIHSNLEMHKWQH